MASGRSLHRGCSFTFPTRIMQLTNSSLAQLFTIPVSDWTAINQRVGLALLLKNIASTVEQSLPGFETLETACEAWSGGTFQSLVGCAQKLSAYASEASQQFSDLKKEVDQIKGDTVPDAVQQLTLASLQNLKASTAPLVNEFQTTFTNVSNFMHINQQVDADLENYQSVVGPSWTPVTTIAQGVDQATGLVTGVFQAILNDLNTALAGQIDVTMPFLEGLSLDLAIEQWNNLVTETNAFVSEAPGQEQYWNGPLT